MTNMPFENTALWQAGFETYKSSPQANQLRDALLDMRRLAQVLVNEISADLREFTVHDVTHLDALWSVASEIVGPSFTLTPTEAFVLGGAFLLHDAGMSLAAYPGGLNEIKQNNAWRNIIKKFAANPNAPTSDETRAGIAEFIRSQHANRALNLPKLTWHSVGGNERTLIENGDLRQKFGNFIGEVAASHWWSHDRLSADLNKIIPAPPPFPTLWSIDLLKIAAVLRVADAAQIDERRAPGFLFALRAGLLSRKSEQHWLFQNRLTQPQRRGDALYYSSTSDFSRDEAEAWWLAYDTIRMVDDELRRTDVLLADLRGEDARLATRRIANCETPTTMVRSIGASGWTPIDTSIRITDVPTLIKNLGGEALYGQDPLIPLRELVQNAADSIRLRSAVQPNRPPKDAKIILTIGEEGHQKYLEVQDDGVGMTADILKTSLLDFGDSGWHRDPIFLDYPSANFEQKRMIGKYGIGFFSVFMLGSRVEIWTRRFDRAFNDTLALKFESGLGTRPILSPATQSEWLMDGGTRIRVWLDDSAEFLSLLDLENNLDDSVRALGQKLFPALDIPITLRFENQESTLSAIDWTVAESDTLICRITGEKSLPKNFYPFLKNLQPIVGEDGSVLGRMCVLPMAHEIGRLAGVITIKGIAGGRLGGVAGVVEGEVLRAARDMSGSIASPKDWRNWARNQVSLIEKMRLKPRALLRIAEIIASFRVDTGTLPICHIGGAYYSKPELCAFLAQRSEISVLSEYGIRSEDNAANDVIIVSERPFSIFDNDEENGLPDPFWEEANNYYDLTLEGVVYQTICEAWKLDEQVFYDFINARATESNHQLRHQLPIEVISDDGNKHFRFGFIFRRSLKREDFDAIAARGIEEREKQQPRLGSNLGSRVSLWDEEE